MRRRKEWMALSASANGALNASTGVGRQWRRSERNGKIQLRINESFPFNV